MTLQAYLGHNKITFPFLAPKSVPSSSPNMAVRLIFIAVLIKHMEANCRPVPNTLLDFGDFFVPNPTRLRDPSGVITSSNYPEDYNLNEQCGFIIEAPEGSRIKLG